MKQKSIASKDTAEKLEKRIHRKTSQQCLAKEKMRIVLAGFSGWKNPCAKICDLE